MARFRNLHDWDLAPTAAVRLQQELREQVRIQLPAHAIETIAGADISFNKYSETVYAAIVVLRLSDLQTIETAGVVSTAKFPYIPGLLSFREIPCLIEAWQKLQIEPDAIVLDGQGMAHPRRMGIACHAGLIFDRPAIGCAKSVLCGKFDDPFPERGSWSPMIHRGETVGAALRTKNRVQPVYVSPGHFIDLDASIELMLQCDGGYRVPEATRRAHLLVNEMRFAANQEVSEDGAATSSQKTLFDAEAGA